MPNSKLTYLGPVDGLANSGTGEGWTWRQLPWVFLLIVVAPSLLAAIYFLLIASPVYVSEARFIVRQQGREAPSSLGIALQGVGLSTTQSDAFAVHEYIVSRDALTDLEKQVNVRGVFGRAGTDMFSRYPQPWNGSSEEELYKGVQRFITVGYDSTNGISTLRVEAFSPEDARRVADILLSGGERLVNNLNVRASEQAVLDAERSVTEARARLSSSQAELASFRNREQFIDPARTALESSQVISGLMSTLATLRAERQQIAADTPSSPQLPSLDGRIHAYEQQIEAERAKIAGNANSLAPKVGLYLSLIHI